MRISDWSSDVCSSDLGIAALQIGPGATIDHDAFLHQAGTPTQQPAAEGDEPAGEDEIGERQRDQRGDEEDEKEFHGVSFSTAPSRGEVGVGACPSNQPIKSSNTASRSGRSEERRVGKECVSTCRSRGSPYP